MAQLAFAKTLMRPSFTPTLTWPKVLLQRLLAEGRVQMPQENVQAEMSVATNQTGTNLGNDTNFK